MWVQGIEKGLQMSSRTALHTHSGWDQFASGVSYASLVAHLVKNLPTTQEAQVGSLGGKIPWRREWQPIKVFFPGELHGQRSPWGSSPWDHKEFDSTERLWLFFTSCHFSGSQRGGEEHNNLIHTAWLQISSLVLPAVGLGRVAEYF